MKDAFTYFCRQIACWSPEELTYLSTSIAVAISKCVDKRTLSLLSGFFFNVSSALSVVSNQKQLIEDCRDAQSKPCKSKSQP